jgi:S1-C subfamily serine protease
MEDLNKNQIVLLTLLVSFVTSISTSIMTNSLLQEAPIEVTRNINRIVEKTIETVTPATSVTTQKEVTTVVVKEEDLVIESIDKNIKSIVRINARNTTTAELVFYGIGLVYNKEGLIVAQKKEISSENKYVATMHDDREFVLTPVDLEKRTNFIFFKTNILTDEKLESETEKTDSYEFFPAVFSDVEPKLGQTLVGLGGDEKNSVTVGRVASFDYKSSGVGTSTVKYLSSINTNLTSRDLVSGSPVFNLSGDIVGIRLSFDGAGEFTPNAVLKREAEI